MKAYLYKFMPLLIFVIGLIIFYVFNDYPTLIHVIVIIAKLHITSLQLEETLSSERIKRKVISRHKAQRLKCIFFTVIVVVIISMLISLYLKLMVIFGLAVTIFILASISVAIFEKYFTIIENM